jgi:hypothetical protein
MRIRIAWIAVAALVAALTPTIAAGGGAGTTELYATMKGGNEVPKGDPKASGTAEIKLTGTKVCWEFKLKGVKGPSAAHIHKGGAGKAGPVVVPFGTKFKRTGCTTASNAIVKAILSRPGGYYVNVHTAKYPAGAVRGQLSKGT